MHRKPRGHIGRGPFSCRCLPRGAPAGRALAPRSLHPALALATTPLHAESWNTYFASTSASTILPRCPLHVEPWVLPACAHPSVSCPEGTLCTQSQDSLASHRLSPSCLAKVPCGEHPGAPWLTPPPASAVLRWGGAGQHTEPRDTLTCIHCGPSYPDGGGSGGSPGSRRLFHSQLQPPAELTSHTQSTQRVARHKTMPSSLGEDAILPNPQKQ